MADSDDDFDDFFYPADGLHKVPKEVYIVSVSTEWPIDVVSGHPASHAVPSVEGIVNRRLVSGNVGGNMNYIKIFKARLTDVEEVEFVPGRMVPPELRAHG